MTVRRSTGTTTSSSAQDNTVRRSTGTTTSSSTQDNTVRRTTGTAVRESDNDQATVRKSGTNNAQSVRITNNVTGRGLTTVTENMTEELAKSHANTSMDTGFSTGHGESYRIDDRHNVVRVHPRERDYMRYDAPGYFYAHEHPHYFGYRVEVLPPRYYRRRYYGVDYYYYNNVYYRPYGGRYIVCRPPVGVIIEAAIADMVFRRVSFAYYNNVYRTYRGFDSYTRYIDAQNRTIAQNNAIIAQQNRLIAMNLSSAQGAYDIANRLGLAQSYAYANQEYFYDDGVFYIINNGHYQVITPPAGAIVEELPDDYDTITLGGAEYYRVDDTVYRVTMISGHPYLEVLGQMYGSMARQYSLF